MNLAQFENVRKEKKLTKAELCRRAGISDMTYDNIINKKSMPGLVVLESICRAMHVNPAILWEGDTSFVEEPAPEGYKRICQECEKKQEHINELMRTIKNLNDLCEGQGKKKGGKDVRKAL